MRRVDLVKKLNKSFVFTIWKKQFSRVTPPVTIHIFVRKTVQKRPGCVFYFFNPKPALFIPPWRNQINYYNQSLLLNQSVMKRRIFFSNNTKIMIIFVSVRTRYGFEYTRDSYFINIFSVVQFANEE